MEEQNKKEDFEEKSTGDQLGQVLNRLDERDGLNTQAPWEEEVFGQSPKKIKDNLVKKSFFKDLAWYWRIVRWPILLLAGLEILTYVVPVIWPAEEYLLQEIINPILLLVDLVVFGWIVWEVRKKRNEDLRQTEITVFLAGFGLGFLVALFKFFWIRQFWTLFNLIIEPVFMGLMALAVGLLAGIFMKRKILNKVKAG